MNHDSLGRILRGEITFAAAVNSISAEYSGASDLQDRFEYMRQFVAGKFSHLFNFRSAVQRQRLHQNRKLQLQKINSLFSENRRISSFGRVFSDTLLSVSSRTVCRIINPI